MNFKNILIVLGEPYSTFSEIIGKCFDGKRKYKNKIILIGSVKLLNKQLKKLGYRINFNIVNNISEAKRNMVNIINIDLDFNKSFKNISSESNRYIKKSFNMALDILKKNKHNTILINGPISKKTFLKKKYSGITEYLSMKTKSKGEVMLIYNKNLSVSPLTTHIPIKYVTKNITKRKILENISKINKFYKQTLKKKCHIAVLGLNPHCETTSKYSEEEKIIIPSLNILKKRGIKIKGPFSADTFFLNKNINKYDVVVGMYHDQVLTPIKTLFNFNAINITIGLPFIRISPDHGPNSGMVGKNKSDPSSLIYAIEFIEKLN